MRNHTRAGVVLATTLLAAAGMAAPASADESAVGARAAGPSCTSLSNGSFCVAITDGGHTVRLVYGKTGGSAVTVKFGFRKGNTTHLSNAHTVKKGDTKVYEFKNQQLGCSTIYGVLAAEGQGDFETPGVHNTGC
ncbi:hypothetical protein BX265_7625 [Streptomyces sp. TLI_235]|nr:hypothetical protein [Streptomyces sp. TLI_235]PBC70229.1 hypothetical protein BX265_7625 [Streptomyces sp. TLI_235]